MSFLNNSIKFCIAASSIFFVSQIASSHARLNPLQKPAPRSESSGLKSGPCGNIAATTDPTKKTALLRGSELEISFQETIDHPGYYRIAFSQNDDNGFEDNILIEMAADIQGAPIPPFANPRDYTVTITLPDLTCENCSLQLIQVMTDRNPPSNYYSCADIRIVDEIGPVPAKPAGLKIELQKN